MVAAMAAATRPANAGYLIDPTGGTVLWGDSTDVDDITQSRPLGFTFNFFGAAFSDVDVSTNGNLNFSDFTAWTNAGFPYSTAMIAPLWDDLYIFQGSGQKITEKSVAGQYYSVTWDVSQFSNSVPRYQFQVVLFGGTTSINGTTYLPDDIVFAYQRVDADFYDGNATVGLNKGDGTFATLPDVESSGGLLGNSQADLLPTASQLLLLARPDGSGDYGGAFVTAVPEPSTWVLCVGGLACAAWGAMRRGGKRGGSSALAAMVVPVAFAFCCSHAEGGILSFQVSGSMTTSSSSGGWSAGDPFTASYSFDSLATGVYNPNIPATAYAWTVKSFDFTVAGKTYSMAAGAFGDISVGNNAANAIDRYIVTADGIQHPPLADGLTVSFIQFDFIDQTKAAFTDESLVTSPGVLQAFEQKSGRFRLSNNDQPFFEVTSITAVPEPSSVFLVAAGVAGLACCLRWQRRGQCRLLTASSLILVALSGGIAHAELVLSVSPGVVLSPGTATIGGVATGPLNGQVYGPVGYNGAPGGTTGFVTSTFVLPASSSSYQLVWEVSNVGDGNYPSALAIDNVRITSGSSTTVLFGFETGIHGGFTSVAGSVSGASPAITNLSPAEGAFFAFIDTTGSYDTAMGMNGSRLISSVFSATAGDVLAIDTAFLTTDSTTSFGDYGFVALSTDGGVTPSTVLFTAVAPVPEPSTWVLCAGGLACTAYGAFRRRKRQQFGRPFIATALLTLVAAFLSADPAHAAPVTIDWVAVGDSGNSNSQLGYGAVSYEFKIGKYEVTIGQYAAFLNAVAKADDYGLYDTSMASDLNSAGISRTGSAGSYSYSVMNNGGNSVNRPITYVSWWDAARFANWMHNGQPSGPQGDGTTETGAYTLNGAISGIAPSKNVVAQFYIPTENEWFKAAYYNPTKYGAPGGWYSYYYFATQSDSNPGNAIGTGTNQANGYVGQWENGSFATGGATLSPSQNYLTDVGAYSNNSSYFGTFDQTGNVDEWNDLAGTSSTSRGLRGGSWSNVNNGNNSWTARNALTTTYSSDHLGFRLAAPVPVPEPSTSAMVAGGFACAAWGTVRRRSRIRSGRVSAKAA
jgi:formylglycine-generating enzyme required for sulfatase activity